MPDIPAGSKSADTCRTERVAHLNDAIRGCYRIGQTADAQDFGQAQATLDSLRSVLDQLAHTLDEESQARERERGG